MDRLKKNIFIVANHFEQRLILSREFAQYGFQIFEFQNTQQIIPFMKIQKPNVCIIYYEKEENDIAIHLSQVLEETDQKCFVIFLLAEEQKKNDLQTRLNILRMGGKQIFYLENNQIKDLNLILKEIDDHLDLESGDSHYILYLKNNESFNEHYIDLLRQKFKVDVFSFREVYELLNSNNIFVLKELYFMIILNVYYEDFLGVEIASIIRQFAELKHIPIIFISKEKEIGKLLYTIQRGGDEYLIHPIDPEIFFTFINSHYQKYRLLMNSLEKDRMTNLYNHHTFIQKLTAKARIYKKASQNFAFCLVDIDNFKRVNDTYGHLAGDQVIVNLARFLKHNLRAYDLIGRYGGEEFSIFLNVSDKDTAYSILDRIRKNFSNIKHYYQDLSFSCTISGGIAMYFDFPEVQQMISAADSGLYKAKENGRNKIIVMEKK
ncbi:MAG: GGDEF domain-containing protein [Leptonema sp. (in: bacteria)]